MKSSIKVAVPVALAALGSSDPVHADDLFLGFGLEIQGESTDAAHKNEIDVISWSWNMSQEYDSLGRPISSTIRDIKINKFVDKATPQLALRLLEGKLIKEGTLTVRSSDAKGIEYLKIKMTRVRISKLGQGSAETDPVKAAETVALNFDEVCITYTGQRPDGSTETPVTTCWDIQAGKSI
jgi:type VI secretion system secreted protein Hcp